MNTPIMIIALVLSFISFTTINAATAGTCSATISIAARPGSSWNEGGLFHQIYDITVVNNGACPINSLLGLFVFPATASVSEAWNYNKTTGQISGFSGLLVGQTFFGAGFVLAGTGAPSLSLEHSLASCPAACVGTATVAPTVPATSAPTATPTAHAPTAAPTARAPTAAPTTPAAPACGARITITARANAAFLLNALLLKYTIWR